MPAVSRYTVAPVFVAGEDTRNVQEPVFKIVVVCRLLLCLCFRGSSTVKPRANASMACCGTAYAGLVGKIAKATAQDASQVECHADPRPSSFCNTETETDTRTRTSQRCLALCTRTQILRVYTTAKAGSAWITSYNAYTALPFLVFRRSLVVWRSSGMLKAA